MAASNNHEIYTLEQLNAAFDKDNSAELSLYDELSQKTHDEKIALAKAYVQHYSDTDAFAEIVAALTRLHFKTRKGLSGGANSTSFLNFLLQEIVIHYDTQVESGIDRIAALESKRRYEASETTIKLLKAFSDNAQPALTHNQIINQISFAVYQTILLRRAEENNRRGVIILSHNARFETDLAKKLSLDQYASEAMADHKSARKKSQQTPKSTALNTEESELILMTPSTTPKETSRDLPSEHSSDGETGDDDRLSLLPTTSTKNVLNDDSLPTPLYMQPSFIFALATGITSAGFFTAGTVLASGAGAASLTGFAAALICPITREICIGVLLISALVLLGLWIHDSWKNDKVPFSHPLGVTALPYSPPMM